MATKPLPFLAYKFILYQATKMVTAYTNNVVLKLGDLIRKTLNHLGSDKQHRDSLRRANNYADKNKHRVAMNISEFIKKKSPNPTTCATSIPEMEPFNIILDIYINQPFLKNNLWYEIKANPRLHFRTMVLLARLQEDLDIGGFQAFPISRSWIPAYVTF